MCHTWAKMYVCRRVEDKCSAESVYMCNDKCVILFCCVLQDESLLVSTDTRALCHKGVQIHAAGCCWLKSNWQDCRAAKAYQCWNIVAMRSDIMSSADSLPSSVIAAGQAAFSNDRSALSTHRRLWICDACQHFWGPRTSVYTVTYLAHPLHNQRLITGHRTERAPCQGKDALQAASAHDPLRSLCSLGTTSFCKLQVFARLWNLKMLHLKSILGEKRFI